MLTALEMLQTDVDEGEGSGVGEEGVLASSEAEVEPLTMVILQHVLGEHLLSRWIATLHPSCGSAHPRGHHSMNLRLHQPTLAGKRVVHVMERGPLQADVGTGTGIHSLGAAGMAKIPSPPDQLLRRPREVGWPSI